MHVLRDDAAAIGIVVSRAKEVRHLGGRLPTVLELHADSVAVIPLVALTAKPSRPIGHAVIVASAVCERIHVLSLDEPEQIVRERVDAAGWPKHAVTVKENPDSHVYVDFRERRNHAKLRRDRTGRRVDVERSIFVTFVDPELWYLRHDPTRVYCIRIFDDFQARRAAISKGRVDRRSGRQRSLQRAAHYIKPVECPYVGHRNGPAVEIIVDVIIVVDADGQDDGNVTSNTLRTSRSFVGLTRFELCYRRGDAALIGCVRRRQDDQRRWPE